MDERERNGLKMRYETKRNPIMSGALVLISIIALLFVLMKADFANMIFGKIGTQEPPMKTMTEKQYADVLAIWKQQNTQNQDDSLKPDNQIAPQVIEQKIVQAQTNEPGSVYQYTDASGMIVMVDALDKVPAKYRAKMKTSSGMYGQQRTAVKVQNNQIWVPVTFGHKGNSVTTWLLLDTGASNTSISPALARRLGIQATETTSGMASLADGRMVQTANVIIGNVTVGPKVKRDLSVQIMPRVGDEETGLLGMNFLAEFPHSVDAGAGVIRWQ
jgi:clan AA aspartic protease (TIGR02281 family)